MSYLLISIAIMALCFILFIVFNQLNLSKKVHTILNLPLVIIPWLIAFAYVFTYLAHYIQIGTWGLAAINLLILAGGIGCAVGYRYFTKQASANKEIKQ